MEPAFAAARSAQPVWEAQGTRARARWLSRFHDEISAHREDILALIQAETGKARLHAFDEYMHVLILTAHYARTAERILRPRSRRTALPVLTRAQEIRHAHGVVGHISPWNYPFSLGVGDAITPLLAGNALVHMPDQKTSLVSFYCRDLAVRAGLDPALWQILVGDGSQLGPEITRRADFISFTGSTATGISVAKLADERMVPGSLELGGKNGMLITAGADLRKAAEAAVRGCFSSAGQLCVSIERIYVEQPAYERFRQEFLRAVRRIRLGVGYDSSYNMGSLTSAAQLERVQSHVDDAVAHGARLLAGGSARPEIGPWVFEPTVLEGVTEAAKCFAEETFGPLVSLYPVDSVPEGIEKMNSTPFGLNASVWAASPAEGARLARQIRSGTVNVDEMFAAGFASIGSPMQGYGLSGRGGRHGEEGLREMTWAQTVAVQRLHGITAPKGVSSESFVKAMHGGIHLMKKARIL